MSTTKQKADIEGTIAEAELTDEEEALVREAIAGEHSLEDAIAAVLKARDTPETPAEPTTEAEQESGEPTKAQFRALERQVAEHEAAVNRIMGGTVADFETCDECGGMGLVPPGPKPQHHRYFRTCETCAGFGQVLTGSHREGKNARDCPRCGGNGYLEALDESGAPLADRGADTPTPPPTPTPELAAGDSPRESAEPEPARFGTPSWMGDPSIGS